MNQSEYIQLRHYGYSEEEIKNAITLDAIKNYMDDERELKEELDIIEKENHPKFKKRRGKEPKKREKYKRNNSYWEEVKKENKKIIQELRFEYVKSDPYK